MDLLERRVLAIGRVHARRALTCAASLAGLLVAAPAMAQVSVEVSPLRVELTSEPGGTHTQAVTLSNQGGAAVRIRATAMDWFLSRDGTPQFDSALPEPEQKYGASSWVRVAPPEQVVEPGETATVRFTTAIPAQTPAAGYRAAIMFDVSPASGDLVDQRRSVRFVSRVATLVYLTVGKPAPAIDLTNLYVRAIEGEPEQVVATLTNTGSAYVRSKGQLIIYDGTGAIVRELDVPSAPLLPESERDLAISTVAKGQEPLPAGDYRVEVRLDLGMPALLVGETTLKVAR